MKKIVTLRNLKNLKDSVIKISFNNKKKKNSVIFFLLMFSFLKFSGNNVLCKPD